MTMGRLLRSSAARTETHCKKSDEVCCLSACALVYYGGAAWRKTDMLGVHRPSRIDAANIEYDEVKKSTADADTLVSAYLKEMEVPQPVVEAMMETPPERITVVFIDHKPTAHADADVTPTSRIGLPGVDSRLALRKMQKGARRVVVHEFGFWRACNSPGAIHLVRLPDDRSG